MLNNADSLSNEAIKGFLKEAVDASDFERVGDFVIGEVRLTVAKSKGSMRARTNAEVGVEVCALIEVTKGWTPTKGIAKDKIIKDSKAINALLKRVTREIVTFNSLCEGGPTFLTNGLAMNKDEILAALNIMQAHFGSEVIDYASSLEAHQLLSVKDFIEQLAVPVYKSLFMLRRGKLGKTVNEYPDKGKRQVGSWIRFGRIVFDAADKPISDSTLYSYAPGSGVKKKP